METKTELNETELMMRGYGLTTAEFTYRLPDFQHVLNTFLWQAYERAPEHAKLRSFIDFWKNEIEGPLHSVRYVHRRLIGAGERHNVAGESVIH